MLKDNHFTATFNLICWPKKAPQTKAAISDKLDSRPLHHLARTLTTRTTVAGKDKAPPLIYSGIFKNFK